MSRYFFAAAQLALYHTLELSAAATTEVDADACTAGLAAAPQLAALVTTLLLPAYLPAHGPFFHLLALRLALPSIRALAVLTDPAFDANLLAAVPSTLVRLALQPETLHFAFFDRFLAEYPQSDAECSQQAWSQRPRAASGLGPSLHIPPLADRDIGMARESGVSWRTRALCPARAI